MKKIGENLWKFRSEIIDRSGKVGVTGNVSRLKGTFSGAALNVVRTSFSSLVVWVAYFRLAGEASSPRRRAPSRRLPATKSTLISRNRRGLPRKYASSLCHLVRIFARKYIYIPRERFKKELEGNELWVLSILKK